MAIQRDIIAADMVFLGEDKQLSFTIYQADGTTPQNVAGWTFAWALRKKDGSPDPALLEKTSAAGISITGSYSGIPENHTQRIVVTLADTDTATGFSPATYRYSLKRMDEGQETVLAFGNLVLRQATVR